MMLRFDHMILIYRLLSHRISLENNNNSLIVTYIKLNSLLTMILFMYLTTEYNGDLCRP